ncbi:MAG: hypothetical protein RLZ10_263 [Bacteroidota bacterium]|jgi:hypothetical protein
MDLEKRIELAKSYEPTKKVWRHKASSDEFKFCNQLSQEIFGDILKIGKCECVEIFFFKLNHQLKNEQIKEIMEKNFFVKQGKLIRPFGMRAIGTNSSDEDCIRLLKANPKYITSFEKYPSNWEEIVNGKTSTTVETPANEVENTSVDEVPTKELIEMSNSELKAYAKSIGCELLTNSKAKMLAEIEIFEAK